MLQERHGVQVTAENHGHGATELTCSPSPPFIRRRRSRFAADSIFCVDIDEATPDLVLIDFAVNDYGHPKLMDALLRKALALPSRPEVVLVNLWVQKDCPVTRYLHHAHYYAVPVLDLCPAVDLCFGRSHLPRWRTDLYSTTDGVHPWGVRGVNFIGSVLMAWWDRTAKLYAVDALETVANGTGKLDFDALAPLPAAPLYRAQSIGACTRCDALVEDAPSFLTPLEPPKGFRVVTRAKIGYGGFNPASIESSKRAASHGSKTHGAAGGNGAVKSFKKCWQAEAPGDTIKFRFFGSSVENRHLAAPRRHGRPARHRGRGHVVRGGGDGLLQGLHVGDAQEQHGAQRDRPALRGAERHRARADADGLGAARQRLG